MSTRTSLLALATATAFAAAFAPTGVFAKPITGVIIKPKPVMGVVINPKPVLGIIPPKPIVGVVLPPHPVLGIIPPKPIVGVVLPPHPVMGVPVTPPPVTGIVIHQVAGGTGGEAIAYSGTSVVRRMRITSGRHDHPTPGGVYTLGDAGNASARSSLYGTCVRAGGASRPCSSGKLRHGERFVGTPMPNFRRFYRQGNATALGFHTGSLSTPSHGCIHLSPTDSAWVFKLPIGTSVRVDTAPSRPTHGHKG